MEQPKFNHKVLKQLIRIRCVEQAFLDLFSKGKLNGTVHTCIGQEYSAVAFAGQLKKTDFIFSNHRCHGHYIAYTNEWKPLILELLGKKEGVCSGIGSSQHLQKFNFFSNGIQGGIMPIAAGFALGNKLNNSNNIGIVFIGDGTLGEGLVYETLNFLSIKKIPLIVVCENNMYAQSTPSSYNIAGEIKNRALAFDIEFRESETFNLNTTIMDDAKSSIDYVRSTGKPIFHLVNTYRLKAHSKGDDDRDKEEILQYENIDFLNCFQNYDTKFYNETYDEINKEINNFIDNALTFEELDIIEYLNELNTENNVIEYLEYNETGNRQIQDINKCFINLLEDKKTVFIGEDIIDPYGGAFKATKGLSTKYPERVIGTTISEALIAGVSNGLALNGFKPYAEFMFGDFIALAFDQFINHSAKIYNMYNKKVTCPVVFRTPMGGKRGYGPTHSQSIEKHFVGMDTFKILTLNKYLDPVFIYKYAHDCEHPVLIIENKVDYGKKANLNLPLNYEILQSNEKIPNLRISPIDKSLITTTIITYGSSSELILDNILDLLVEHDELVQVLILSVIDPLPNQFILENISEFTKIITVEEGTPRGSIGDNIISMIAQNKKNIQFSKVTSDDITIPSAKSLEEKVLVNYHKISNSINSLK
jgi:2-oxoisovalerate dehydrogenase E1 component